MDTQKLTYIELLADDKPPTTETNGLTKPGAGATAETQTASATTSSAALPEEDGDAAEPTAKEAGADSAPTSGDASPEDAGSAVATEKEKGSTELQTAPAQALASSISASTPTKVHNVALVNAIADVAPGVADVIKRAKDEEYKGSPAERRKAVYADMERLRTHALFLRDAPRRSGRAKLPTRRRPSALSNRRSSASSFSPHSAPSTTPSSRVPKGAPDGTPP